MTEKSNEQVQVQDEDVTRRVYLNGSYRRLNLFRSEPNPADFFIPKNDKLAILFQVSVTKREIERDNALEQFKKDLKPSNKVDPKKCTIEYRISSHGKKHFYEVVYHVYDLAYGEDLYQRLKIKYFD